VNVANAYSALARKHGITILQRFLVSGDTQLECDSMHTKIEQRMVSDAFTERDYVVILECQNKAIAYKVKRMKHSDFMRMDGAFLTCIRPGKKGWESNSARIAGLRYEGHGEVKKKLSSLL